MAKTYGVAFSNSDPRTYPSLAPTFLVFSDMSTGASLTRPSIAQLLVPGVSTTGVYQFNYTPSFPIFFLLDGITTSSTSDRYVYGILDPIQRVDEQLAEYTTTFTAANSTLSAIGTSLASGQATLVAIGNTLGTLDARIGATTSTFGDSSTDPGTIYGYLKRIQEFLEGNATFTKATGGWNVQSRGGSLLASKTLANSSSQVTKV